MNALADVLRLVTELFAHQHQAWALVGGLAVSVRAEPRFTRDIDLAVAVARHEDLRAALDAAQLVAQRGFNRSRDLAAALTDAWKTFGGPLS